jgi:hypothetical protein
MPLPVPGRCIQDYLTKDVHKVKTVGTENRETNKPQTNLEI